MKLVLFDIDGTLVRGLSTERRFAKYLWQQRRIGLRQILSFAWFVIRYFPRFGTGVLRKNKAYLAGIEELEVQELADEFVELSVSHVMFEPACARVRHHLQVGDAVFLLSGTLTPIARSIAKMLRLENVVASDCPIADGKLVGRPPVLHPYGKMKLEVTERICRERGIGLDQVVAYADSWADRYLMNAVGTAVAVLPDKKLAALAVKSGWETLAEDIAVTARQTDAG